MRQVLLGSLIGGMLWALAMGAPGVQTLAAQTSTAPAGQDEDPFAQSQLDDPTVSGAATGFGGLLTVRGFVDAGFINITQTGPLVDGGDLSWAFGNSQFTFFSQATTFTVNEVDLTLEARKESGNRILGTRLSIDYYPSRDSEAYSIANSDKEFDVDQAFVFFEYTEGWKTRFLLGRAPGFVTLEQQEADSPDLRLIGHTYVFQAGGGYPYGFQVITRPSSAWSLKFGLSNGGVGAYSFFPGDDSTLNRPTARDADNQSASDQASDLTVYGAVEWVPLDKAAEGGTFKLGLAAANNSGLTFNSTDNTTEPYTFTDLYLSYRSGMLEIRSEVASLEAYYELSLGQFEADMMYFLLSLHFGANHLLTTRFELINYTSGLDPNNEGEATKFGLTYRYRFDDPMVLKVEGVHETQSPQFFNPTLAEELTTDVFAVSWVYSY